MWVSMCSLQPKLRVKWKGSVTVVVFERQSVFVTHYLLCVSGGAVKGAGTMMIAVYKRVWASAGYI